MIIDSHAYIFLPLDSPRGYSNTKEHLDWVQSAHARHHQPSFRINDRVSSQSSVLDPKSDGDLTCLPEANFRLDKATGRVVWTVDGEDHTKHYFPPNLTNMEFSPHSLVGEMDYAGVDMALIHTDPMLVRDSNYLKESINLYPNRLRAMAPVDEWRILADTKTIISSVHTSIYHHGLHAIKFHTPKHEWMEGAYKQFWEEITSYKVPIFFTLGTSTSNQNINSDISQQKRGYIENLIRLRKWSDQYPENICSVTHGFPWRLFLYNNEIIVPDPIWEIFDNTNIYLEVCFPVRIGDKFEYPYKEVWSTLKQMTDRIGADRLMWGTDMPFQNRFCTYAQSRQWIENHCTFLNDEQISAIMGDTTARILGLDDKQTD